MRCLLACAWLAAVAIPALSWAEPAHASSWCVAPASTDRAPNVIAGYPVRVTYVIPSDGEDRLGELATTIQTDAETIDSWWRRQDPTRTVRFDLAPFLCGAQLDLRAVRLPQASAELAAAGVRSTTIANALALLEPGWVYRKYLVYYDGPVENPATCGGGGNPDEGPGFAMVFLRACRPLVPSATVAAHELIHALGAVPARAPHNCRFPSNSHTCDDEQDIMFPYADGSPLVRLLLDPGRDDYYGHSGTWYDVRESDWLVQLDRQVALSLTIAGSGWVQSDVPGVACKETCTTSWNAGTRLTLTPRPAAAMRFLGWMGACSGVSTCTLTLKQAVSARAVFAPKPYRSGAAVTRGGGSNAE